LLGQQSFAFLDSALPQAFHNASVVFEQMIFVPTNAIAFKHA